MSTTIVAASLAASLVHAAVGGHTYAVDADHTAVTFQVRHMMVSNTQGQFKALSGSVTYDEAHPEQTRVEVTIDAASVDTGLPKRDEHLRSADFFDAAKHPKLTFRSKRAEVRPGGLRVWGDLTIRGVTREVALEVEGLGPEVKDPWGGIRRGATARTRVSRKDYGLNWNAVLEAGGVAVGDEVQIALEIELLRKP